MNKSFVFKILIINVICVCSLKINAQDTTLIKSVTAEEFYAFIGDHNNAVIFDVRDEDEFEKKKIPGAINLPQKEKLLAYTDTLDKETPILIYCEIGQRSKEAAKVLLNLQFVTIINLNHGFKDWLRQKYPVEK